MERKAFEVAEVKAVGGHGEFEALVSVFGNVDRVGDRVHPGAFEKAIKDQEPPPVVWFHQWEIPPIGETLDWGESKKGLVVKGRLFVGEDDRHQYADMVYAAMKSRDGRPPALRQFSFAYDVEQSEETFEKGARVRELKSLYPITEVGPCLKAVNPSATLVGAAKGEMFGATFTGTTSNGSWMFVPSVPGVMTPAEVRRAEALPKAKEPPAEQPTEIPNSEIPAWRFPPRHATTPDSR